MTRFLLICLGGALGTGARYLVSLWAGRVFGTSFPYGTLLVNVVGCFAIALVLEIALTTTVVPPTLRLVLTTGFLGGFTTYSSFNWEATRLLHERAWGAGFLYSALTVLGGFGAGLLGMAVARRVVGG